MATKQTRLTPFGRKVRKRLIDKNMTQVELAAFRRTDSNSEYNIDIESNGVEVIVE